MGFCCGQSMLRYRSELLRTMGTLLFLPAFLTGVSEQKQVLEVELFYDYTDDPVSRGALLYVGVSSLLVQLKKAFCLKSNQ